MSDVPMVNVQVDGEWKQFPKGTRVIDACKTAGKFIPHYCYHEKLSTPGNCRMCLVEMGMPKMDAERKPVLGADGHPEINWIPRPQISCAQMVAEGMAVKTDSKMVKESRRGVMEFLLINHPLDCPICDQAGECKLQEFSLEFGNSESRFLEHKVKKPKNVELGPRITIDDERCILCTRCIRFMREVVDDDVLGITQRGSHNTVACHPERELDSNYSLNTVDICPVGALTSNDFRFQMRVWFLKETKSICTKCSTGCNTIIGSRENKVFRQTPRDNDDVNECWMCDTGRLDFHYVESGDRLTSPSVAAQDSTWKDAFAAVGKQLDAANGSETAIIASARMTNEELFLTAKLAAKLDTTNIDVVPRTGEADGILVAADRNPNTAGAKLTSVTGDNPGAKLADIAKGVKSGTIKTLLVIKEDPTASGSNMGLSEEDLGKLESLIVIDILPNAATKHASILLPSSAYAEKRGSMVNGKGRLQRLNQAVQPPEGARNDWEILRDILKALGAEDSPALIEDVFAEMASSTPALNGLTLSRIGDEGKMLKPKPTAPTSDS